MPTSWEQAGKAIYNFGPYVINMTEGQDNIAGGRTCPGLITEVQTFSFQRQPSQRQHHPTELRILAETEAVPSNRQKI